MRRAALLVLCLAICGPQALAQARGHARSKRHARAKQVVASGCVRQGVECLVLEPLEGGQKYSLTPNRKLEVGWPYRIIGTTSNMGYCMEGYPILRPRKVSPIKARCPK